MMSNQSVAKPAWITGQHSLTSDLTTLEEARRAGRYFVAKQ
jgi:hypothetical protein